MSQLCRTCSCGNCVVPNFNTQTSLCHNLDRNITIGIFNSRLKRICLVGQNYRCQFDNWNLPQPPASVTRCVISFRKSLLQLGLMGKNNKIRMMSSTSINWWLLYLFSDCDNCQDCRNNKCHKCNDGYALTKVYTRRLCVLASECWGGEKNGVVWDPVLGTHICDQRGGMLNWNEILRPTTFTHKLIISEEQISLVDATNVNLVSM